MKLTCAYSLFLASLCALPSAHAAVRGRSLVRGVSASSNRHRLLEEIKAVEGQDVEAMEAEGEEVDTQEGEETENEGGEDVEDEGAEPEEDEEVEIEEDDDDDDDDESPIAPKKRDCKTKRGMNGVTFECKATTDEADAKVKDEIDYTVETSERGLMVKIKYEQEIKVAEGEVADEEAESEVEDADGDETEEIEASPEDEETSKSPEDEETEAPIEEETEVIEEQGGEEVSEEAPEEESAEQETETQFEVIYDSIIEYTKGEASSTGEAYDWENDVVLQTISLNTWDVMSEIDSNDQASSFSVTSPDGTTTFTFTINQAASGQHVTANKMKIDFELKDFPWTSDESFVALLSTVETERKVDVKYRNRKENDEPEMRAAAENVFISFADVVDTSRFTPFGEYSWAETAEATSSAGTNATTEDATIESSLGNETTTMTARSVNTSSTASGQTPQTISVVATSPLVERADRRAQEGKQVQSIAYSFVGGDAAHRAANIYWDPSAGVDYQSSARPLSLAVAGAGIVFTLFALF